MNQYVVYAPIAALADFEAFKRPHSLNAFSGYISLSEAACNRALLSIAIAGSEALAETGSTLILPLFKACVAGYGKVDPYLHITSDATGLEAGIDQVISQRVQIGTWDAYMCRSRSHRRGAR